MMIYAVMGLGIAAIYGSRWLLESMKPKPNKSKEELKKTIHELRQQAEELNTPSTYSAYSKLNKQVERMEKEMHEMPDFSGNNDLYWVIVLMPYIASFLFIGQYHELSILGEDVYWPIGSIIGYQEHRKFYLSLSAWYIICLMVTKTFIG